MRNFITDLYNFDKQSLALYLQAFATFFIGLLVWTTARGQNILAQKKERRDLFKLRYENIYQVANNLFDDCKKLTDRSDEINGYAEYCNNKKKLPKQQREIEIEKIKNEYKAISQKFKKTIESNKFLMKNSDYDKLYIFCNYINGQPKDTCCLNYYIATYYNEHWEKIPKILNSYLYHENESKTSYYFYKIGKYLKNHLNLFLKDYFPAFLEILGTIILTIMMILGILYGLLEYIKEILKAPISIKNEKIHFELKMKSDYLKRNRPWPL